MHSVRREGRRARAARGALAAAIAIATAATAHTLAGDGAPPVWLLLAVTALAAPLAVWLAGRALSTWRTAAIVILSQTLLHAAFAAVGTGSGAMDAVVPNASLGHAHAVTGVAPTAPAMSHAGATATGLAPALHGLHVADAPMLVAHALAAAVTIVLLVHGERLARALGRGIRRLLTPVPAHLALPCAPRLRPRAAHRAPITRLCRTTLSLRGPPAFAR